MAAGRHMPQAKRQLQLQRRLQRKLPLQQMHHPRAALQASLTPPTSMPDGALGSDPPPPPLREAGAELLRSE